MFIVAQIVSWIFTLYRLAIIARVLFSYIQPSTYNPFVRFIVAITEPLLAPLRRVIPPVAMFDISPIVAFIILFVVESVIVALLR